MKEIILFQLLATFALKKIQIVTRITYKLLVQSPTKPLRKFGGKTTIWGHSIYEALCWG